jgi:hypothetical protein
MMMAIGDMENHNQDPTTDKHGVFESRIMNKTKCFNSND